MASNEQEADSYEHGEPDLMNDLSDGTNPGGIGKQGEDGDTCRICRGEGSKEEPLFYPCRCSGSIKFVHQACLMEWLSHSQKKHCELCKTPFRFTKLYHPQMPQSLPLPVFLKQVAIHATKAVTTWVRFMLVVCVWLGWLPWSMRSVWRGLFWLGDGGWLIAGQQEGRNVMNHSFQGALVNGTMPANLTGVGVNETVVSSILGGLAQSLPVILFPLAPTSTMIAYLRKAILGFLLSATNATESAFDSSGLGAPSGIEGQVAARDPSWLSEVNFLKDLTSSTTLNNIVIDVLEGQLITLLVVVAFILVFLIREWVVQQQPIVNLAGELNNERRRQAQPVDHGEEEAGVIPLHQGVDPQGPESDHESDDSEDDGEESGPEDAGTARAEVQRPFAVPRPRIRQRPAITPTTTQPPAAISQSTDDGGNEGRDTPSANDLGGINSSSAGFASHQDISDDKSEPNESHSRPGLPGRNAISQATNIQRSIEENRSSAELTEGPSQQDLNASPSPVIPLESGAGLQQDLEDHDQIHNDRSANQSAQDADWSFLNLIDSPSTRIRRLSDTSELQLDEGDSESLDPIRASSPLSSPNELQIQLETPRLEAPQPAEDQHVRNLGNQDHANMGLWNRATDWLWGGVIQPPQPNEQEPGNDDRDDGHVVRNLAEEPPFVPVINNVPPHQPDDVPAGEADNPFRDPEAAAAAAQAGLDPNDPEIVEELEDLEGVMELIGMQGPVFGLVQNCVFCALLIALTLTFGIWTPYILGKFAALILANPFSIFIRAPTAIVLSLTGIFVDLLGFVIGSLVYWIDPIARLLLVPVGIAIPPVKFLVHQKTVAKLSSSIAGRCLDRLTQIIFMKVFSGSATDIPFFSAKSHDALHSLQDEVTSAFQFTWDTVRIALYTLPSAVFQGLWQFNLKELVNLIYTIPVAYAKELWSSLDDDTIIDGLRDLNPFAEVSHGDTAIQSIDFNLASWNTKDRIVAVFLGYTLLAVIGALYIKGNSLFTTGRPGQRLGNILADALVQAGGVMKVILIIGIEMILFPLYCGVLLDIALLPLFENITLMARVNFTIEYPLTSLFVHWFVGTCYMFHFALFVSMCRKVMRTGVLCKSLPKGAKIGCSFANATCRFHSRP